MRRGKTAKEILTIDWVYPVWKPVVDDRPASDGSTRGVQVERALPLEQAYELVTDGDRRPLLILRECEKCKGTDHALLSRSLDNEQTVLLTHWFRCVKLPTNVVDDKHPFFNLFKREKEGQRIPHLFFVDPDGSHKAELPGDQPQTALWNTMFEYLDRCYAESAKEAIKELRQVLGQYDKLDAEEQLVKSRMDREIEKNGPESPKLKKFDADLSKVAKKREQLKTRESELRDLALKAMAAPKSAEAAPAQPAPAGDAPAGAPPVQKS
ncbi:MAG: hypothetical protein K8J09_23305 [Planctomycetes bacterium]|nr:hypothetical protein [Planctomycetota bacterium]MCC7396359.1 hypothetical protein [Planctomycetota bacterium]